MADLVANNIEILRLLNRYRFLTNPQFLRLGLVSERTSVYRILDRFKGGNRPYIGQKDFGFIAGKGKLNRLYYMEKRGAKLLAETLRLDEDEVNFEKVKPPFLQDYYHRISTIDFHIELDFFAKERDCEVPFFHTYFDREGANRGTLPNQRLRSLTKVKVGKYHLIPDAIFSLIDPEGKAHLFAVEVYNGHDTKRVVKQLQKHVRALEEGAISTAYSLNIPYKVLLVFDEEPAMHSAIKRVKNTPEFDKMEPYFAFNSLERIKEDFGMGWHYFHNRAGGFISTLELGQFK